MTEWKFAGPCAFCGHPDSRHRVVDAIIDRIKAGDDPEGTLDDYGMTEEIFDRVAEEVYPTHKKEN